MRRSSLVTLVLMLAPAAALCQSSPILLHDGQPLTFTGTLVLEPAGRLQFVTVKTTAAYLPVFKGEAGGKEHGGEVLHEIGIAGYSDYALLYAHRGQEVTVEGKMATDEATHPTSGMARGCRSRPFASPAERICWDRLCPPSLSPQALEPTRRT